MEPIVVCDEALRNKWMTACEEIRARAAKGIRLPSNSSKGCEGLPDYLWSIPTDMLTTHLNKGVLRCYIIVVLDCHHHARYFQ